MTMRKYSGVNILVIALAHADRSEGESKFGLSFDWRLKKKLQIDWANCLSIAQTSQLTNKSLQDACFPVLLQNQRQNKRL